MRENCLQVTIELFIHYGKYFYFNALKFELCWKLRNLSDEQISLCCVETGVYGGRFQCTTDNTVLPVFHAQFAELISRSVAVSFWQIKMNPVLCTVSLNMFALFHG